MVPEKNMSRAFKADTGFGDTNLLTIEVTECLAEAIDPVAPQLVDHHKRVAIIAGTIATELQMPRYEAVTLVCAALIHDIGVFSARSREDLAAFDAEEVFPHCLAAYLLLKEFPSFSRIADCVRFHHLRWDGGRGASHHHEKVDFANHILHLADRVHVLLLNCDEPLARGRDIVAEIRSQSNTMFHPECNYFVSEFRLQLLPTPWRMLCGYHLLKFRRYDSFRIAFGRPRSLSSRC